MLETVVKISPPIVRTVPNVTKNSYIMKLSVFLFSIFSLLIAGTHMGSQNRSRADERHRIRDYGIQIGILKTGPLNSITDVPGVRVGHCTLVQGDSIRTGVTAVLPHSGNIFREKVPAGIYVANGFGKMAGVTQVEELGQLETPVILTNTLSVPVAADALIDYTFSFPQNRLVRSVNPVVGETNDGWLNDIRGRHVTRADVLQAIETASEGPVEEGDAGAGTGTVCFGYKGGIGTASRVVEVDKNKYTLGVLVQTNFGGVLHIAGVPIPAQLASDSGIENDPDGSCMIVVATDVPLDSRQLKRLARRAMLGLGRVGGISSHGSGDYVIAFSVAESVRMVHESRNSFLDIRLLRDDRLTPFFTAAIEATEEAILNSLFKAHTVSGYQGHMVPALPIERALETVKNYHPVKP